ncbi:MAG: hypothetical protein NW701_03265 [Nitrospira sp.]
MSKLRERKILEEVYGRISVGTLFPNEAPDFLWKKKRKVILGVEVTEYYNSETDARLKLIGGYALDVLKSQVYRHKHDKLNLRVETVTYLPGGDETKAFKIDGIFREIPSIRERLDRLGSIVHGKVSKSGIYLNRAPFVDLIVNDGDCAFRFENFADLYRPYSLHRVRSQVIESPFREVFLLTEGRDSQCVCIPLRANGFVEEVKKCERLYIENCKQRHKKLDYLSYISVLVEVLTRCGFGKARFKIESGLVKFRFASIELTYCTDGTQILDQTLDLPLQPWGDIVSELAKDIGEGERSEAEAIYNAREQYFSCCELLFAARGTVDTNS